MHRGKSKGGGLCRNFIAGVHKSHLQHCSCFRDVVIDQILGLHYIEVSSYECCHQMSDFEAKNAPNSTSAGAPPQTPLGKLTTLPQTL